MVAEKVGYVQGHPTGVSLKNVCEAVAQGDQSRLLELLTSGDAQNAFNGDLNDKLENMSAIHLAAMSGHKACAELLIHAKADPSRKGGTGGKTAFEFAHAWGYSDMIVVLEHANEADPVSEKDIASKRPTSLAEQRKEWLSAKGYRVEEVREVLLDRSSSLGKAVMPVALLFPGQGSQYVGMLKGIKDIPAVQDMLKKANEVLDYDLLDLCLNGPETKLEQTRFCQPAVFMGGLAGLEKLRLDRPGILEQFQACAGLSLGEYTALCAAGVFSFEDALRLVQLRGEAMHDAAQFSKQAMLSVAGLERARLDDLCAQAAEFEGPDAQCCVANVLFAKGFACAGTEKAVLKLKELVGTAGALQAKVLKAAGAFHTPLMAPAASRLKEALHEVLPRMKPPQRTVYMNVTGKPLEPGTDPKVIVSLLQQQLTTPVLWEPLVREMIQDGISEFYEVGPMKQIKAMIKRINPSVWSKTYNISV